MPRNESNTRQKQDKRIQNTAMRKEKNRRWNMGQNNLAYNELTVSDEADCLPQRRRGMGLVSKVEQCNICNILYMALN